jgi:acyl-coenzyme A thioesterase PaaI-like protein
VTIEFAAASAVTPTDAPTVFDVGVDPGWVIGDKPNGGYLLATIARAALAAVAAHEGPPHPHVVSASAAYVESPPPGPAQVEVDVLRRGRRMSQVRARLTRDGAVCVESSFTLGRHDAESSPWWSTVAPPDIPPPDACVRIGGASPTGLELPIMERVDIRLDPAVTGFAVGRPGGGGELRGWLTFADGHTPDPLSLLFALDAFPPATFELAQTGWVPTLELTAYVRALPVDGPLLVRQTATHVQADIVDEVCHVWDARGRLVAHATQLAGIRVGDAEAPPTGGAGRAIAGGEAERP